MQIKTALVIDDSHLIRDFVRVIVSRMGYNVIEAENGAEGLELFKKNESSIAFVVLDVDMPVLNGIETLKGIVDFNLDAKVIMMTGNENKEILTDIKAIKDIKEFRQLQ